MNRLASFSDIQREFLSVMSLFESPVSIDVLETLQPIPRKERSDLLQRGSKLHILKTVDNKIFSIDKKVSSALMENYEKDLSPKKIGRLLHKIEYLNLCNQLSPSVHSILMTRSGNEAKSTIEVSQKTLELLEHGHLKTAHYYLKQSLYKIFDQLKTVKEEKLFIDTAFNFSKLSHLLGRDWAESAQIMERAKTISKTLGNKRAWALSNLHLGLYYHYLGKRKKALETFSIGKTTVDELGNKDILTEASVYLAYYYFIMGDLDNALDLTEKAIIDAKLSLNGVSPTAGYLLRAYNLAYLFLIKGYCLVYLGNYSQAVGFFYSQWQDSIHEGQHATANILLASLGSICVLISQYEDAYLYLKGALNDYEKTGHSLARYTALGGLALLYYRKKDFQKSHLMLTELAKEWKVSGIVFTSSWYIEVIAGLEKIGFPKIPGLELETQLKRMLNEPNQYALAIALRILAEKMSAEGKSKKTAWKHLQESELLLEKSGDPAQLSKTRLEMAKFMLEDGKREEARQLVNHAYAAIIGQREDILPDGLRPLLEEYGISAKSGRSAEEIVIAYQTMLSELALSPNPEHALEEFVAASNRFFGAERGGIFSMDRDGLHGLSLQAVCNLGTADKDSRWFKSDLRLIHQAFKQKEPIKERAHVIERSQNRFRKGSILCLPFYTDKGISGVLYHDNSYMDDCFNILQKKHLLIICKSLEHYVSNIFEFSRQIERAKECVLEITSQIEGQPKQEFITKGRAMAQIIEQAMSIAPTDGTVLIMGETGVGKDLLARFIRSKSNRSKWPLVTIDCTTIPETLFESELFGYEKGSFTGANQKKIGQVELADKGTLFIDEIGEMSLTMQTKLLRLLQEKHFKRIGGYRMISSDFRLIAATNRNLLAEVKKGSFRRDLYYRLNIFPITIPPLRDRKDEIVTFAEQFLERYAKKYSRPTFTLSKDNCRQLMDYAWPGNVRELENLIERAVLMSKGSHLNLLIPSDSSENETDAFADNPSLDELQRRYILHILKKTNGKVSGAGGAANILKIKRTTLTSRIKKLGIRL